MGGAGLANCLFVAVRAYILAKKTNATYINPTWVKFSLGPYIRKEKDKRHYFGLFNPVGVRGLKKIAALLFCPRQVTRVEGLGDYFENLLDDHAVARAFFDYAVTSAACSRLKGVDFSNVIGIHVRLGDYGSFLRTSRDWYQSVIEHIDKETNHKYKFWLFSDGSQEELDGLLSLGCVERKFFGNALADILALSKTRFIIGSDSTFSGWGAFLGQVPVVFPKRHFGRVLINGEHELVSPSGEGGQLTEFIRLVL